MKCCLSSDRCYAIRAIARTAGLFARLALASGQFLWLSAPIVSPPDLAYRNEMVRRYNMDKPLGWWQLERNPVSAPVISAREVAKTDTPVPGIPPCGFARPVFWRSAKDVVVDRRQFTDLRTTRAREAQKLGPEGIVIGRVLDTKHDPRQIVKLLVLSGVVDANIHVVATVSLMEEANDSHGYWARLVSDDRYWTNRENRVLYDFAVRVLPEGEIRLMNANHVGMDSEGKH